VCTTSINTVSMFREFRRKSKDIKLKLIGFIKVTTIEIPCTSVHHIISNT